MGAFSLPHTAIALAVAALLFGGGGRISGLMGDAARGVRAFRLGLKGEDHGPAPGEP